MKQTYLLAKNQPKVPAEGNTFFFDTNVWLSINGPFAYPTDRRTHYYSGLLKHILNTGGQIAVDALVLTEFINRYMRDHHRELAKAGEAHKDFKTFRATPKYQEIAAALADELFHMLKDVVRLNLDFKELDIEACIKAFSATNADFNDIVFWKLCRSGNYFLVTDDSDCDFDIPIVTANEALFKARC